MPTRLQSTGFTSQYGFEYDINIIDVDHVGSATDIEVTAVGISSKGNDRAFEEIIYSGTASLSFLILTPDDVLFLDDIMAVPEGRFYLEIKRGLTTVFKGRILTENIEVAERYRTELKLTAIDGITNLKTIDYDYTFNATIATILTYCLNQIDVIDTFYTGTDKVLVGNSALTCDTVGYTNLCESVEQQYYFFRVEDDKQVPFTCFEVIEEILRRYFLELHYHNGKYYVIGKETYKYGYGSWLAMNKNLAIVTHLETVNVYDIGDDTDEFYPFPGTYHTTRGIKRAIIQTEQDFINYKLGTGKIYDIDDPYELVGTVIADDQYVGYTTILLDTIDPNVATIRVKLYYRYETVGGGVFTYLYDNSEIFDYNYSPFPITVTSNGTDDATEVDILATFKKYIHKVTIPTIASNAYLSFKFEAEFLDTEGNPVATSMVLTATNEFDLNPPKIYNDKVKFEQENDTGNTKELIVNIYGCDQYGSTLSTAIVEGYNSGDSWRFDATKAYRPLERSILEEYLYFMTKPIQYYSAKVVSKQYIITPIHQILYKTKYYKVGGYKMDIANDEYKLNLIYLNYNSETVTDNTVLTTTLEPYSEEINISGLISNNSAPARTVYEFFNVTTNSVTIPFEIIESLENSQKNSFDVFVSGIRYFQVSASPGFRQYTIEVTPTNTITFANNLRNEDVIVIFRNQLIPAATA